MLYLFMLHFVKQESIGAEEVQQQKTEEKLTDSLVEAGREGGVEVLHHQHW